LHLDGVVDINFLIDNLPLELNLFKSIQILSEVAHKANPDKMSKLLKFFIPQVIKHTGNVRLNILRIIEKTTSLMSMDDYEKIVYLFSILNEREEREILLRIFQTCNESEDIYVLLHN
jgi:hypothetical protein